MKIKQIVNEALPLSVAKEYTKEWNPNYYKELFASVGAKYRIVIPFDIANDISVLPQYSKSTIVDLNYIFKFINQIFEQKFEIPITYDSYMKNYIVNGKQKFRIVKVLNLYMKKFETLKDQTETDDRNVSPGRYYTLYNYCKQAIKKYSSDTSRTKIYKFKIVISRHPYDIAGMSTDRHWTSCMELEGGENSHYVIEDVKEGTIIAYLVREGDENIKAPMSRVLIKPFRNVVTPSEYLLIANNSPYGTNVTGFVAAVQEYLDKLNDQENKINGLYCTSDKLYPDGNETYKIKGDVLNLNPITDEKQQLSILSNHKVPLRLLNQYLDSFANVTDKVYCAMIQKYIYEDDSYFIKLIENIPKEFWNKLKGKFVDYRFMLKDSEVSLYDVNWLSHRFELSDYRSQLLEILYDDSVIQNIDYVNRSDMFQSYLNNLIKHFNSANIDVNKFSELVSKIHEVTKPNHNLIFEPNSNFNRMFYIRHITSLPETTVNELIDISPVLILNHSMLQQYEMRKEIIPIIQIAFDKINRDLNDETDDLEDRMSAKQLVRAILRNGNRDSCYDREVIKTNLKNIILNDNDIAVIYNEELKEKNMQYFLLDKELFDKTIELSTHQKLNMADMVFYFEMLDEHYYGGRNSSMSTYGKYLVTDPKFSDFLLQMLLFRFQKTYRYASDRVLNVLFKLFEHILTTSPKSLLKLKPPVVGEQFNINLTVNTITKTIIHAHGLHSKNLRYIIPYVYNLSVLISADLNEEMKKTFNDLLNLITPDWKKYIPIFKNKGFIE